jgi:hypothetical protein
MIVADAINHQQENLDVGISRVSASNSASTRW